MANFIKISVLMTVLSLFVGCSINLLTLNPEERHAGLVPVEIVNLVPSTGSFAEREERIDSAEIANRELFIGKKGYQVVFINRSPIDVKFEVYKAGEFLALPIKSPVLGRRSVHVDTLMPGAYDIKITSSYGVSEKTYYVLSSSSWVDDIQDYSHCTIVYGEKRLHQYHRYGAM
jgi:hypothetical protein